MKNVMIFNEWEALNNTISPLIKWKKVYVLYKTSGSCSCWSDEYGELCHSVEEAQRFIRKMDEEVESYNAFHRCGVGNRRDYRAMLVLEFLERSLTQCAFTVSVHKGKQAARSATLSKLRYGFSIP